MHKYLRLFIVACTLSMMALTLLFTPVTSAAPGNGAQSYHYKDCNTYDDYTYCYSEQGVFNYTTTPSGNFVYTSNGSYSQTITDPSGVVVYSQGFKYHYHELDKDAVVHEFGNHSTSTYSYEGVTCTSSYSEEQNH